MQKIKQLVQRFILLLSSGALVGCVNMPLPGAVINEQEALASWQTVLATYVNDQGQIDFIALNKKPLDLFRYVNFISEHQPSGTAAEKLAHYINAYNAMAMYAVLKSGLPKSNDGLKKFSFFFLKRYRIAGENQSLFKYEKMIRELGDPRVHFILNCMSVGCPKLPQIPMQAATLEETLELETRAFFQDKTKLVVDHRNKIMKVSEILKFYTPEFLVKAPSLVAYVNLYLPQEQKIPLDYQVEFIPYDWTFNQS